jgi:hypothetical protein
MMDRRGFLKNFGKGVAGAVLVTAVTEEMVETLSNLEPVFEDEQYNYYWFNTQEMAVRQNWENDMERRLLEHWGNKSLPEFMEATSPVIKKDVYEVHGSDATQVKWIAVPKNKIT